MTAPYFHHEAAMSLVTACLRQGWLLPVYMHLLQPLLLACNHAALVADSTTPF